MDNSTSMYLLRLLRTKYSNENDATDSHNIYANSEQPHDLLPLDLIYQSIQSRLPSGIDINKNSRKINIDNNSDFLIKIESAIEILCTLYGFDVYDELTIQSKIYEAIQHQGEVCATLKNNKMCISYNDFSNVSYQDSLLIISTPDISILISNFTCAELEIITKTREKIKIMECEEDQFIEFIEFIFPSEKDIKLKEIKRARMDRFGNEQFLSYPFVFIGISSTFISFTLSTILALLLKHIINHNTLTLYLELLNLFITPLMLYCNYYINRSENHKIKYKLNSQELLIVFINAVIIAILSLIIL